MKQRRKGFTLIELIVVMAIIAILVLIAAPKFMGYTQKAKLTQVITAIKVSEKAAEQYYLQHDLWPRDQLATAYTDEQLTLWVNDFRNLSGETVTLEDGKYYDVDWNLMTEFMSKPDNDHKYIIQNPVGDIYYANDLTPAGEQTKFAGENQVTTEPIIEVESITITAPKTSINLGETLQLAATVLPLNAINWSSSNENIATISETGLITPISDGTVTFTATSNKSTKSININVIDGNKIVDMALSDNTSFAVTANGEVYAWGLNNFGQLGIGTVNISYIPVKIQNFTGVKMVTVKTTSALALKNDGTVWSWGQNNSGQLGLNHNTNSLNPQQITALSNVKKIASGQSQGYALTNDGNVYSWGYNASGQLGLGITGSYNSPQLITTLSNISDISSGSSHVLAVKNGEIYSWGANGNRQLGSTTTSGKTTPELIAISDVKNVYTGATSSFAIKNDGTVYVWGSNSGGMLGLGHNTQISTPTLNTNLVNITQLAPGESHTLALSSTGKVFSFGVNSLGQLGLGTLTGKTFPVEITTIPTAAKIISGLEASAVIDIFGKVHVFGTNEYGQLGLGDLNKRTSPTELNFN